MKCPNCGVELEKDAYFCVRCGAPRPVPARRRAAAAPLPPESMPEEPFAAPPPPAEIPAEPAPAPEEKTGKKKKTGLWIALAAALLVIAGVLVFGFLQGWFGGAPRTGGTQQEAAEAHEAAPEAGAPRAGGVAQAIGKAQPTEEAQAGAEAQPAEETRPAETAESAPETPASDFGYLVRADDTLEIIGYGGTETDLVIPEYIDGYRVAVIGHSAFRDGGYTSVAIPEGVTEIGISAFSGCASLAEVRIPETVRAIGDYAFSNDAALQAVTIPGSVETVGEFAFYRCGALSRVVISDGVKRIGHSAFDSCTALADLAVPQSVEAIGDYAFTNDVSLASVSLGDGLQTIGDNAFAGCGALSVVTVPGSVRRVGTYAFYGCAGLAHIIISDGVSEIGEGAFYDCPSVMTVYLPASLTSIGNGAFTYNPDTSFNVAPDTYAFRYCVDAGYMQAESLPAAGGTAGEPAGSETPAGAAETRVAVQPAGTESQEFEWSVGKPAYLNDDNPDTWFRWLIWNYERTDSIPELTFHFSGNRISGIGIRNGISDGYLHNARVKQFKAVITHGGGTASVYIDIPDECTEDFLTFSLGGPFENVTRIDLYLMSFYKGDVDETQYQLYIRDIQFYQ